MAKSPGISGFALLMFGGGVILAVAGLRNAKTADVLRALIKGEALPSGTSEIQVSERKISEGLNAAEARGIAAGLGTASGSSGSATTPDAPIGPSSGSAVVDTGKKYLGIPYKFGGSSTSGMDCSGFVNYVLGRDLGWPIPGSATGKYSGHGPTAIQYYNWSTAPKIARSQVTVGDLVCWTGHIGIAVDNTNMINAARPGTNVRIQKIWGSPIFRRPIAPAAAARRGDDNV